MPPVFRELSQPLPIHSCFSPETTWLTMHRDEDQCSVGPLSVGTIHKVTGSRPPLVPQDPLLFWSSPNQLPEHPHLFTEGWGRPHRATLETSPYWFPGTTPSWRGNLELWKAGVPRGCPLSWPVPFVIFLILSSSLPVCISSFPLKKFTFPPTP